MYSGVPVKGGRLLDTDAKKPVRVARIFALSSELLLTIMTAQN